MQNKIKTVKALWVFTQSAFAIVKIIANAFLNVNT